jgi:N-acetyl-anhydromuramyl-L-alanine amidase AmpD
MKIHTVVVHYSATYPDQNITRDDIDKMHRDRGFREIGYHWFIRRDGTLEEGRPEGTLGAHVKNHNSGTIGICFAGGLERATGANVGVWNPTPEQEQTMVELIRNIKKRWPDVRRVVGHRNLGPSQCPGRDDVAAWWAEHHQDSLERTTPAQSTTMQASVTQIAAGAGTAVAGVSALDGTAQIVVLALAGVIVLTALWIMRERLRRWAEGDR